MDESHSSATPVQDDSETNGSADGLSLFQLIVPAVPLMLLVAFCAGFHPDVTAEPKLRHSGTTTKDENGKLSLQVRKTLMVEGTIDWRIGSVSIAQESVVAPYDDIPGINRRIEETRGLIDLIAGLIAFSVFVIAAWRLAWHSRWTDDPPLIPPARAVLIIGCVLPLLAGVSLIFTSLSTESVAGLTNEFQGAKIPGLRMAAVLLLAPLAEELVFRATLQRVLARRFSVPVSVVLQALCFGAGHMASPLHVLIGVFGGLCFGAIYATTNRISLAIATHSLSNAVFILIVL